MSAYDRAARHARMTGQDVVTAAYHLFSLGNLHIDEVEEVESIVGEREKKGTAGHSISEADVAPGEIAADGGGRGNPEQSATEDIPDYADAPTWPPVPTDDNGIPSVKYEDLTPAARASIERARAWGEQTEADESEATPDDRTEHEKLMLAVAEAGADGIVRMPVEDGAVMVCQITERHENGDVTLTHLHTEEPEETPEEADRRRERERRRARPWTEVPAPPVEESTLPGTFMIRADGAIVDPAGIVAGWTRPRG